MRREELREPVDEEVVNQREKDNATGRDPEQVQTTCWQRFRHRRRCWVQTNLLGCSLTSGAADVPGQGKERSRGFKLEHGHERKQEQGTKVLGSCLKEKLAAWRHRWGEQREGPAINQCLWCCCTAQLPRERHPHRALEKGADEVRAFNSNFC